MQTPLTIAAIIAMSEQQIREVLANEFGVDTQQVKKLDTLQKKLCENADIDYSEFVAALEASLAKSGDANLDGEESGDATVQGAGLGGGAGDGTIAANKEVIGRIGMYQIGSTNEEKEDIVVQANGKLLQIQRGIYVGVPIAHINVLKDAKTKERERLSNGALTGKVSETPIFPFTPMRNIYKGQEHLIGKEFTEDELLDIGG